LRHLLLGKPPPGRERQRTEAQLRRLEARKRELDAKLARLRFQHSAEGRKREAQRRFLVGKILLEKLERGEFDRRVFLEMINEGVRSKRERALFGLPKDPADFPAWLMSELSEDSP